METRILVEKNQASGPQSLDDSLAEIVTDAVAELPFALAAEGKVVGDRLLLRRGRTMSVLMLTSMTSRVLALRSSAW
jgi:hypothetical protein